MRLSIRTRRVRPQAAAPTIDAGMLRAALRRRELLPYERIMPADQPSLAATILDQGWVLGEHPPISMRAPVAWDEVAAANRSWHYHLHCWDGLGPLLAAHSQTGDGPSLAAALAVALDWASRYPSLDTSSPFAWYDMAVGLRAYRLAYLLDAAARRDDTTDAETGRLARSALLHMTALDDGRRFAGHSNHGIYQAAGQLALARRLPELPGAPAASERARQRLWTLVGEQFTGEGVHREHSPGYHLLVLDALLRVRDCGLLGDPEFDDVLARAEDALAWFVGADGRLAMIGDTGYGFSPTAQQYRSPALRFVVSGGEEGTAPSGRLRAFPESGYVVMRTWPDDPRDRNGSYLAMHCGFHSRAHKHADDLTFVWQEQGRDVVTDSGRYGFVGRTTPGSALWSDGFNYDHPARVYVESTRAHNTVDVDARNLPRRDVEPYGSGLRAWGEAGDVLFAQAATCHADGVEHDRVLALRPERWLLVLDRLRDPADRAHLFRQWFHLAPEVDVRRTDGGLSAGPEDSPWLHVASLSAAPLTELIHGRSEPELGGWTSRDPGRMFPCWSAAFGAEGPSAAMATVLSLSRTPVVDGRVAAGAGGTMALCWSDDSGRHRVTLSPAGDRPLEFVYEAS